MLPPRLMGILVRMAVAVVMFATASGVVWGLSLATGPAASEAAPALVPSPVVALSVDTVPVEALQAPVPGDVAQAESARAAVAPWADRMAPLVGIPHSAMIDYGMAEVSLHHRQPDCRLSWVTLAAVDRVRSGGEPAADTGARSLATAEALCAGGNDTATERGWTSAVRAVGGDDPAYVQRVLAMGTTYASAVRTGVALTPPARAAIEFAIAQIGLPYVWGGNGPRLGDAGFDCSGLTTAAYSHGGVSLPRTAHTQFFATSLLSPDRPPVAGDLVFYGNPTTKIHHVGLYIGNGQMINAPTFGKPVQLAPYRYSGDDYAGAGRPAPVLPT